MPQAINPATELELKYYPFHTDEAMEAAIAEANEAFSSWRRNSFADRALLMQKMAQKLRSEVDSLAKLITEEMGKPIKESVAEIKKCASVCDYYAEHAADFLAKEEVKSKASTSYVIYNPLGVVMSIMPWNYPFWQVFRFAAPAIMAGNTVLLKHAPNVPGCAKIIADLFQEVGFPKGVFTNLFLSNEQVSLMIAHRSVKAVTLTGSTRAGKEVAKQAGAALKKCVLELGGNDPYIILEDADLHLAVKTTVASRLKNNGQSCISAKRFIVTQMNAEAFLERLILEMQKYEMGDPTLEETDLGPLVGKSYREQLHDQVVRSLKAGAKCVLGGELPEGPGFFYPPTVLTHVHKGMPAYEEELFGPVASVLVVADEEEAMRVANDTIYGLGGAIFSRDTKRAEQLAAEYLEAGSCFVNAMVQSDPKLPFGGINESGYGRELSYHGIREFTNTKTVYVR